jgi:protoporphyrinogen oxidase
MSDSKPSAVVLGAGLAGLRGALYLLEHGFDVEIIERLDEPGGMARSVVHNGYVFDHGPHGFLSRDVWINDEFKRIVGEGNYRWLQKWSQVHYRGEYFNFPLRLSDIASKLPPWTLLHALASFLWSRWRIAVTKRNPANAEEYLVDQFGRVLYEIFFGPYTQKVWSVAPRELDADFTRDRVPSLHLWDVIRKFFVRGARERHTPSGRTPTHDLHVLYYPKQGGRSLPLGYAKRVRLLGGRFRFGATIERVDLGSRAVMGHTSGSRWRASFDYLLNTIPMDSLMKLVAPQPPREIMELAVRLRYRAVLLLCLCVRKPNVIGPFWIYFTDRFFNRISEFKHFSPDLVPDGKTGICLEVGCNEGDELWRMPDRELVRRALPDLLDLALVSEDEIDDCVVIREANAYPIYDVGYQARVTRLIEWIEGTGVIATAGRQGRFLYVNQDAAIKSGFEAGEALVRRHAEGMMLPRVAVAGEGPRRSIIR